MAWPKDKETAGGDCGTVKKIGGFNNHFSLPSFPGQFPWTVAIYRYIDPNQSHYKCAGTIVNTKTILTSANCLLENGFMLEASNLMVHVSPYALTDRAVKSNMFTIAELKPHDRFDFQLRNNIAVVKLYRDIQYNDFVQPICMPNVLFLANEKTGKVNSSIHSLEICNFTKKNYLSARRLRSRVFRQHSQVFVDRSGVSHRRLRRPDFRG